MAQENFDPNLLPRGSGPCDGQRLNPLTARMKSVKFASKYAMKTALWRCKGCGWVEALYSLCLETKEGTKKRALLLRESFRLRDAFRRKAPFNWRQVERMKTWSRRDLRRRIHEMGASPAAIEAMKDVERLVIRKFLRLMVYAQLHGMPLEEAIEDFNDIKEGVPHRPFNVPGLLQEYMQSNFNNFHHSPVDG